MKKYLPRRRPLLFHSHTTRGQRHHGAIRIVCGAVAYQSATTRSAIVGDGQAPVLPNNFQVEGNHAFSGHVGTARSRAMRSMATRAGKSGIDMGRVLIPTGGAVHRRKIMALPA